ncbi:MAG: CvpA family protein [Pirellula sp.]|nr:CvpA family protein [Pirellula sp.]
MARYVIAKPSASTKDEPSIFTPRCTGCYSPAAIELKLLAHMNASNMQTYDILMLIILAATTIFGGIKGFAWQVASLASIVASYFIAYTFRNDVAKMINADPPWNLFLAMLLLYFGSSFVIWMVFRLVSTSIDKVKLREFDRHLGAGFGFIKGVLLCLIVTMFAMSLLGANQQQRIANSRSGFYISKILANAGGILPAEIKQVVGPYINSFEQRLQQGQAGQIPPGELISTPGAGQGGLLENLGRMADERGLANPFGGTNQPNQSNQPTGGFPGFGLPTGNGAGGQSQGNSWEFGGGNFGTPNQGWGQTPFQPGNTPTPPNNGSNGNGAGGGWPILPQ